MPQGTPNGPVVMLAPLSGRDISQALGYPSLGTVCYTLPPSRVPVDNPEDRAPSTPQFCLLSLSYNRICVGCMCARRSVAEVAVAPRAVRGRAPHSDRVDVLHHVLFSP